MCSVQCVPQFPVRMAEYELMKEYIALGKSLEYEGEALRVFVNELSQSERNRRAEARDEEREKRELKQKEIEAQLELKKQDLEIEKTRLYLATER